MGNTFCNCLSLLVSLFVSNSFAQNAAVSSYGYSKIENDFYFDFDSSGNKIDSILMYTPIVFFTKGPHDDTDTLFLLSLSDGLEDLHEPLIYKSSGNDCLRFAYFRDTLPIIFRINKLEDNRFVIKRKISNGSTPIDVGIIISSDSAYIGQKQFTKILQLLEKGSYWNFPTDQITATPNILVETLLNSKYSFITGDSNELRWNPRTRSVYKCYEYLNKLFR
jgi:hypothetical protein